MPLVMLLVLTLAVALAIGCSGGDADTSSSSDGPTAKGPDAAPDVAGDSSLTARDDGDGGQAGSDGRGGDSTPIVVPDDEKQADLRRLAAMLLEPDEKGWLVKDGVQRQIDDLVGADRERLLPLLSDKSVEVRRGAAYYLIERIDESDPNLVLAFRAAISDNDPTIRHMALQALPKMSPSVQADTVPQLAKLLNSDRESAANRASIARRLGALGPKARAALPDVLAAARRDPSPTVRTVCLATTYRIADVDQLVPFLREVLRDESDSQVRYAAVYRLDRLETAAASAAPELARALADEDERTYETAAKALVKIGEPAVQPTLEQLASNNVNARKQAILVLASLGPTAKPALPALRKRLDDDDESVRKLAAQAIKAIE